MWRGSLELKYEIGVVILYYLRGGVKWMVVVLVVGHVGLDIY